ncbi:hypothetical protein A7A08_02618 [Methyloligella halotolerans]|uniref:Uncharacterized protein n=1 Tax=Methyloligella halotolerans TaxID=1177755 RepID=A0A1E2RWJ0_9HYPH|nr:hypothetical protein [Methyloligella halotolerans]ODA66495.1 hypothetical protein A7A08_02618 [Methyloligella halotolerans]
MFLALLIAGTVFAVLSLPGWLFVAGRNCGLAVYIAAGFCSQAAVALLTALVALVTPGQLPILAALLAALALGVAAFFLRSPPAEWLWPRIDPWAFPVAVCATFATALIIQSAVNFDGGDLVVRAFFNADGFKHIAHVRSLASFGLPARDIFTTDAPLAYYWFAHIPPAVGAALSDDAARSLVASDLLQTFAFWILVYGLVRAAGATGPWAAFFTLIGWLSPSFDGLLALIASGFDVSAAATQLNIEGLGSPLLNGSTLFRLNLYIPQHQFVIAGLLSWGLLQTVRAWPRQKAAKLLSLAPIAAACAISILAGLAALAVYAVTRLLDRRDFMLRRLGEVLIVWAFALTLPLLLGVIGFDPSDSGLTSPLAASKPFAHRAAVRFLLAWPGLLLVYGTGLVGLYGLLTRWRLRPIPEDEKPVFRFALALCAVGLTGLLLSSLINHQRLALEWQLRVSFMAWVGLAIACAWLVQRDDAGCRIRSRGLAWFASPLLLVGLITPVLDASWHAWSTDRWTVRIPGDDLKVLKAIARSTPLDAVVLQKPERPFLLGGEDVWVPVVSGRRVFASDRATDWNAQELRYDQATAYFEGVGPLPEGGYDYLYLSRKLHPESYSELREELENDPVWRSEVCLPDACLFAKSG